MSAHPYRSHTCSQLRKEHKGQKVRIAGWLYRKRDQKHQVFILIKLLQPITRTTIIVPDAVNL